MPLFAYRCRICGEEFQTLVTADEKPACTVCESEDLERLLSRIAAPARGGDSEPALAPCGAPIDACCGSGTCRPYHRA
jgi:putative FmdB family regulatory protein